MIMLNRKIVQDTELLTILLNWS